MKNFMSLLRDEEGATAIEYGLIAGLIAIIIIAAMAILGPGLTDAFTNVTETMNSSEESLVGL